MIIGIIETEGPDFITTLCTEEELEAPNEEGPWPYYIGYTGEEYKDYIESKVPNLDKAVIVNSGDTLMRDLNMDSVRIFIDKNGLVNKVLMRV